MVWLVLPWRASDWGLVLAGTQPQHRCIHPLSYLLSQPSNVFSQLPSFLLRHFQFTRKNSLLLSSDSWLAVTRLMLSELRVVTDCAAVVLCTVFVQSVHQTGCTVHFSHICAGRRGWWYSSINCKLIRDLLWKAPCNTFDSIHHSIIIADQLSLGSCEGNEAVINVWLVKIITIQ